MQVKKRVPNEVSYIDKNNSGNSVSPEILPELNTLWRKKNIGIYHLREISNMLEKIRCIKISGVGEPITLTSSEDGDIPHKWYCGMIFNDSRGKKVTILFPWVKACGGDHDVTIYTKGKEEDVVPICKAVIREIENYHSEIAERVQ